MRQIRQIIIVVSRGACECSLYTFLPFVFEHSLKKKNKTVERNDKQIALLGTQQNFSGLGEREGNLRLGSGQPGKSRSGALKLPLQDRLCSEGWAMGRSLFNWH